MIRTILNAQWQGGGDPVTYHGAAELAALYLSGQRYDTLPISTDRREAERKENGIAAFQLLQKQMRAAQLFLRQTAPEKLLSIGGGCDADVPVIAYLNGKYQGDLAVLWLDAHGDLNTPEESSTALFYGMPLRSLMDETCFGLLENPRPLTCAQIVHAGGRDFDASELAFIQSAPLRALSVTDIRENPDAAARAVAQTKAGHVYIHLDLDVLDPGVFPDTPLPVPGGLLADELLCILASLKQKTVGMGIYEYMPTGRKTPLMERLLHFALAL